MFRFVCICFFLFVYVSFCLYMFLFVCICFFLFVYVSFCLYMFLFVCICFFLFVYVSFCLYMFVFVCICLYMFLFVCICFFLFVYVSFCLYMFLFVSQRSPEFPWLHVFYEAFPAVDCDIRMELAEIMLTGYKGWSDLCEFFLGELVFHIGGIANRHNCHY